ncbi:hypothetical protein At1D1609_40060 [Agrobacterium tumefaciens]|uniref:Propionyl-coenzyme A carboxylase alpha polypeptide n=1 Tax=Agrobacterium tumefaciens TaxID=358 RepID=A0A2L2LI93_AGRTU|nr:hypothetical protein At1D1609_40060 [Agrobacterium tumefaciens]
MAAALPPSVLPDISPSRREITRGTNFHSQLASLRVERKRGAIRLSISPLEGEMSGRTEGGNRHALRGQTHAR